MTADAYGVTFFGGFSVSQRQDKAWRLGVEKEYMNACGGGGDVRYYMDINSG